MKVLTYPVLEVNQKNEFIIIKAGKKWTDGKKIIQYEGFNVRLHNITDFDKIEFAVITLKDGEKTNEFELGLHAHSEHTCEQDSDLIIDEKLLKKWTGLKSRDLEVGVRQINVVATLNLISTMPRLVTVSKEQIEIEFGPQKKIDALNSCNLLFNRTYPLDV